MAKQKIETHKDGRRRVRVGNKIVGSLPNEQNMSPSGVKRGFFSRLFDRSEDRVVEVPAVDGEKPVDYSDSYDVVHAKLEKVVKRAVFARPECYLCKNGSSCPDRGGPCSCTCHEIPETVERSYEYCETCRGTCSENSGEGCECKCHVIPNRAFIYFTCQYCKDECGDPNDELVNCRCECHGIYSRPWSRIA